MAKPKLKYLPLTPAEFLDKLLTVAKTESLQALDLYDLLDYVEPEADPVEHDWENYECVSNGFLNCQIVGPQNIQDLCFLGITAGGDWEVPLYCIFYFSEDGKLCRYTPDKGNVFNFINRSAFGNDESSDYKAAAMAYKKKPDEINSFNEPSLLEDIRLRFGIKKVK